MQSFIGSSFRSTSRFRGRWNGSRSLRDSFRRSDSRRSMHRDNPVRNCRRSSSCPLDLDLEIAAFHLELDDFLFF